MNPEVTNKLLVVAYTRVDKIWEHPAKLSWTTPDTMVLVVVAPVENKAQ